MNKRKIQERLLLGLLVAAACSAPLACSDDNGGKSNGSAGDAGASGSAETAGIGGSVAHGGEGGTTAVGGSNVGGADVGGADMGGADMGGADMGGADMGGANVGGGAGSLEPGAAGEAGMGGADNSAEEAAQYQTRVDAICTVEASLDCTQTEMPAKDKQSCVDTFSSFPGFDPKCVQKVYAYIACLAPQPAASYECSDGSTFAKDSTCPDAATAMYGCFG